MSKRVSAWLELLRLPNLFSVPGDVLAGASLAYLTQNDWPAVVSLIFISFFLYAAGLLLNDYFDFSIDQVQRPERPLPSGRISTRSVLIATVVLITLAVVTALAMKRPEVFWTAVILALLIFSYNAFARKIVYIGLLVMGLCRGFNILLGASIGSHPLSVPVIVGAGIETLYIIAVSLIAFNETKYTVNELKFLRWTPLLALTPFIPLFFMASHRSFVSGITMILLLSWVCCQILSKERVSDLVGGLIRGLIPLQATLILVTRRMNSLTVYFVLFLCLLFIGARQASKKYYGS
jgi:4-hydroxybenzoate polyprenyltransferase